MKLTIKYKYKVRQVVYFMYENEIRKGIVSRIEIWMNAGPINTCLTELIVAKTVQIFDKDYPMESPNIRYTLDLVSRKGGFESGAHLAYEDDIYEAKIDILNSL